MIILFENPSFQFSSLKTIVLKSSKWHEICKRKYASGEELFCGKKDLALMPGNVCSLPCLQWKFSWDSCFRPCLGLIFQLSLVPCAAVFLQLWCFALMPCECSSAQWLPLSWAATEGQLLSWSAPLWQWCLGKSSAGNMQWQLFKNINQN